MRSGERKPLKRSTVTINDMPRSVTISELRISLRELERLGTTNVDRQLGPFIARHLDIPADQVVDYQLERRSLDARRKPKLAFLYRLQAQVADQTLIKPRAGVSEAALQPDQNHSLYQLERHCDHPREPVVVGTGPAGMMAAYLLALHGCKPLLLDCGFDVERRGADIAAFHASRELDTESNYLFGEGGAGTYSDGKLYTRVKDWRVRFLLEAWVAAKAPKNILWHHHPHIGSDILPHMARHLRHQIETWGGRFRWGARVVDVHQAGGRCQGVRLAEGEVITSDCVIMAVGHSARGLLRTLAGHGIAHKAKGFQLGCRIEHDQALIDRAQYGCQVPTHLLGAAEYQMVSRPRDGRANTSTFCMCPGGEIIPATSASGQLSTNGMSRFARASGFANAGLIVNQELDPEGGALVGFDILDRLEAGCFQAGGADYSCPAQSATAFVRGEASGALPLSSYRLGIRPGRLDQLLPRKSAQALVAALIEFERRIPGFLSAGTLIGLETRVSSPVRFERRHNRASSLPGLYLIGEGAGYAGGIVSAGLDGLTIAQELLTKGLPSW